MHEAPPTIIVIEAGPISNRRRYSYEYDGPFTPQVAREAALRSCNHTNDVVVRYGSKAYHFMNDKVQEVS